MKCSNLFNEAKISYKHLQLKTQTEGINKNQTIIKHDASELVSAHCTVTMIS